ncbi:hypothetical protein GBF38_010313 [Nibea albiflora]|uniref:Uncharacterized protein n=1 Tax=Nibea albiflora TaxID=240163 RepID=A0ACB7F2H9_NIBAL|nr:hypothetical protein GBF38_010313 [Nibea albiflora]
MTEQLEKQHSPGTFNLPPQDLTAPAEGSKGQQPKAGGSAAPTNGSSYPDLSPLNPPKETTYQIENFAQAFGSQFKSGRRTPLSYGSDPGAEVDHRIRTPVSEFSGYTSLLADVSEPVDKTFKPNEGFSGATVLELQPLSTRAKGVKATVEITFQADATIDESTVKDKMNSAAECTGCPLEGATFATKSLCESKPCDLGSTTCVSADGNYSCNCKDGYIETNLTSRVCIAACLIGEEAKDGECIKLPKKGPKKSKEADIGMSQVNQPNTKAPMTSNFSNGYREPANGIANSAANTGMQRFPRAATNNNWESRTNLDMTPSNSRQNLIPASRTSRYDDDDDAAPYAQVRPQSSLYSQARPQSNLYAQTRPQSNPYAQTQPQSSLYAQTKPQSNPYALPRPQSNPYAQTRPQSNPYASSQGQSTSYFSEDVGRRY